MDNEDTCSLHKVQPVDNAIVFQDKLEMSNWEGKGLNLVGKGRVGPDNQRLTFGWRVGAGFSNVNHPALLRNSYWSVS